MGYGRQYVRGVHGDGFGYFPTHPLGIRLDPPHSILPETAGKTEPVTAFCVIPAKGTRGKGAGIPGSPSPGGINRLAFSFRGDKPTFPEGVVPVVGFGKF